jgi:hypothetical protein
MFSFKTEPGQESSEILTLPGRSEVIVKIPVASRMKGDEGIVEKAENAEGIYLANSLSRVENNHVITSILNTREQEAKIIAPKVQLESYSEATKFEGSTDTCFGVTN